jgi:hypothetical protein
VFEKQVEVMGEWRKCVNELHDLYCSPNTRAQNQGGCTSYGVGAIVQGSSGEA